jgi:hypothetical protein
VVVNIPLVTNNNTVASAEIHHSICAASANLLARQFLIRIIVAMLSRFSTCTLFGIEARAVEVEVDISPSALYGAGGAGGSCCPREYDSC